LTKVLKSFAFSVEGDEVGRVRLGGAFVGGDSLCAAAEERECIGFSIKSVGVYGHDKKGLLVCGKGFNIAAKANEGVALPVDSMGVAGVEFDSLLVGDEGFCILTKIVKGVPSFLFPA
jgi:hypothetical protein